MAGLLHRMMLATCWGVAIGSTLLGTVSVINTVTLVHRPTVRVSLLRGDLVIDSPSPPNCKSPGPAGIMAKLGRSDLGVTTSIPLFKIALVTLAYPLIAFAFMRWRLERRRRMRRCLGCGGDQASEASSLCPVCADPRTKRRGRITAIAKWSGLVSCLLVVGLWIFSIFYCVGWVHPDFHLVLEAGQIDIHRVVRIPGWHPPHIPYRVFARNEFSRWMPVHGKLGLVWPTIYTCGEKPRSFPVFTGREGIRLPLWMPAMMMLVPTAWLWWRDRRAPEGHCRKCGYNLTGNVSGVCPECGEPTGRRKA